MFYTETNFIISRFLLISTQSIVLNSSIIGSEISYTYIMHTKLIIPSFLLNILLGTFMFVFGGADDSPGAQLLGLIVVLVGISGLISVIRNKYASNSLPKNN